MPFYTLSEGLPFKLIIGVNISYSMGRAPNRGPLQTSRQEDHFLVLTRPIHISRKILTFIRYPVLKTTMKPITKARCLLSGLVICANFSPFDRFLPMCLSFEPYFFIRHFLHIGLSLHQLFFFLFPYAMANFFKI